MTFGFAIGTSQAFTWFLMILDRIPIKMNLDKRKISVWMLPQCFVQFAMIFKNLNTYFLMWFIGRGWVNVLFLAGFDSSTELGKTHFTNHLSLVKGKTLRRIWMIIWLVAIWSIWLDRNDIIFNEQVELKRMLVLIKIGFWFWMFSKFEEFLYSINELSFISFFPLHLDIFLIRNHPWDTIEY